MKRLSLLIICICFSLTTFAQRESQQYDKEKLDAARVAFITNRLDLRPAEAEKFWPLFNEYQEDRSQMMKEISKLNTNAGNETDEEKVKALISKRFDFQEKIIQRERRFMNEIMEVISPSQAVKLSGANREFTRQLYRMQQGRQRGGNRN